MTANNIFHSDYSKAKKPTGNNCRPKKKNKPQPNKVEGCPLAFSVLALQWLKGPHSCAGIID